MFNTPYERPATVLLSAIWSLAAVLAAAAFAISAFAAAKPSPVTPTSHVAQPTPPKRVESITRSSMLREPRLAISKDKLD